MTPTQKTTENDLSEHLMDESESSTASRTLKEQDWWRPSNHNSIWWCCGVLGGLAGVVLLLQRVMEVTEVAFVLALGFVIIEAVLAIVGLIWLRESGVQEARLLQKYLNDLMKNEARKNLSTRAHSSLESSIDTIDSAYQTISNAIIVFGMVGSAAFLLVSVGNEQGDTAMQSMLSLAPKAFSATGYGIWCGLVVGIGGLLTRISYRQAGLRRVSELLKSKDLGQSTDENEQFKLLVDGVKKFTDIMGTMNDSGLPDHMEDVNQHLPQLIATQDNLLKELRIANAGLVGEQGIQTGLNNVSLALGALNETGHAEALATIATHIPELAQSQKKSADQIEQLASVMGAESKGLLEKHLVDLKTLTGELAKQLMDASNAETLRHLLEVSGRTEKTMAEAYKKAFNSASEHMLVDLKKANEELDLTSKRMKEIKDTFSSINSALHTLHGTMEQNTDTVKQRADAYGEAASLVARKVEELTTALGRLGGVGDDKILDSVVDSLTKASSNLQTAAADLVSAQEQTGQKLREARAEITDALGLV